MGRDVHSTNYTLCALEPSLEGEGTIYANIKVAPDYKNVLKFIKNIKEKLGESDEYDIECGYEAGCLGYSLYHQLTDAGVKCVILAPSTMLSQQGKRIKTDKRDAVLIAKCMAFRQYNAVYIPTEKDNSVKEYIRMRDDHKNALKKIKQQIDAFCLRRGYIYDGGTKWTVKHVNWLKKLELSELDHETMNEYMITYESLQSRIAVFDKRIGELADDKEYRQKVHELGCFIGVLTHTALSLIVETGDFRRFAKGNTYAAFLGLAPGEHSSSNDINRTGITKAGNKHLRTLLIECSQAICRGVVGRKSLGLKARQAGNTSEVIEYADRANVRLRKKYYHMIRNGKKKNVAVAAVARELACFIWGMMTDNMKPVERGIKTA